MKEQTGQQSTALSGAEFTGSTEYCKNLVSLCPDAIVAINRKGTIIVFNEAAELLTGRKAEDIIDKANIGNVLYSSTEAARQLKKIMHADSHGGPGRLDEIETEIVNTKGESIPIRLSATLLYKDGQEVGSIGYFHDQTLRQQLEEELRLFSITDSLTGLFNRRHFYAIFAEEVTRFERYARPLSLLYTDLDHFKPFNDNFGHQEGDNILRMFADCARKSFRNNDTVFRLGGDEFVILMVETGIEEAVAAAERFRKSFGTQWSRLMQYDRSKLSPVTISLGAAQISTHEKADSFLKRADLVMYEAKRAGGDRTMAAAATIGSAVKG